MQNSIATAQPTLVQILGQVHPKGVKIWDRKSCLKRNTKVTQVYKIAEIMQITQIV